MIVAKVNLLEAPRGSDLVSDSNSWTLDSSMDCRLRESCCARRNVDTYINIYR